MKMKMDAKQQNMIKEFFAGESTWYPDNYGNKFVAILLVGIVFLLLLIPFPEWKGDYGIVVMSTAMYSVGFQFYIRKYTVYADDGQMKNVYRLLKNTPIEADQLTLFVLRKMLIPCVILTVSAMVLQTMIYLVAKNTFSIGTILMPLVCNFICPVLFAVLTLWSRSRE